MFEREQLLWLVNTPVLRTQKTTSDGLIRKRVNGRVSCTIRYGPIALHQEGCSDQIAGWPSQSAELGARSVWIRNTKNKERCATSSVFCLRHSPKQKTSAMDFAICTFEKGRSTESLRSRNRMAAYAAITAVTTFMDSCSTRGTCKAS